MSGLRKDVKMGKLETMFPSTCSCGKMKQLSSGISDKPLIIQSLNNLPFPEMTCKEVNCTAYLLSSTPHSCLIHVCWTDPIRCTKTARVILNKNAALLFFSVFQNSFPQALLINTTAIKTAKNSKP